MNDSKTSRRSLAAIVQAILMISGVISLISIDDDIVRWTGLAAKLIEIYRAATYPIYEYIGRLIRLDIPTYIRDLWTFAAVMLAGANIYSLQRRRRFAIWEAVKMFIVEQVRYGDAIIPESDHKYSNPAAWLSVALASATPILLLWSYRQQGLAGSDLWFYLVAYLLLGFGLISKLQQRIFEVEDDEKKRRRAILTFNIASLVFLPSALYRYSAFILFCFLIIVFGAWRLYLYMLIALICIFALNEINLRFIKKWDTKPTCVLMSIPETCKWSK